MMANAERGEATFPIAGTWQTLRPSFAALVAAEEELGPLFALVERAGDGQLKLTEFSALFWHCLADQSAASRDQVGEAVMQMGLAAASKPLRSMLAQVLQGRAAPNGDEAPK